MEESKDVECEQFKVIDKATLEATNICTRCQKLLNVSPVYCIEGKQMIEYICGRCEHTTENDKKCRQYAFENIANYMTFPCSNKEFGCNVILHWKDVCDHENLCEHQCIHCPLFHKTLFPNKQCNWLGNIKKVDEHIEAAHKDCLLTPPQFKLEDVKKNNIFFTHVGSQLITVVVKYHKDSKYFTLLMINGTDTKNLCYRYQLELFDENKENSIIFRKARLEPLSSMLNNINEKGKMLEIDIQKLKEMLNGTQSILAKFGIVKKNKKEIMQITGVKDHKILNKTVHCKDGVHPSDETLLLELKCPICNEFMIPPIYICRTGHSICNECKPKVAHCPICRRQFSDARNFTLEKLTTKVYYPCQNREIGCAFVTTSEKIKGHETSCEVMLSTK